MSRLFEFIAKLFGRGRSMTSTVAAPADERQPDAQAEHFPPSGLSPARDLPTTPPANVILLDLADEEDGAEELEDETDEPDPTIGRYEELRVPVLDAEEIGAQRAAFEVQGLSGAHKVFPYDPAGPGSLAETLARLEAEGRVTSRICEDAEQGFYVLYEPARAGPET